MTTLPDISGPKPRLFKRLGRLFHFGNSSRREAESSSQTVDSPVAWPTGTPSHSGSNVKAPAFEDRSVRMSSNEILSTSPRAAPLPSLPQGHRDIQLRARLAAASEHALHRRFQAAPGPLNSNLVRGISVDFEANSKTQSTLQQPNSAVPTALCGFSRKDATGGRMSSSTNSSFSWQGASRESASPGKIRQEAFPAVPQHRPTLLLSSAGAPPEMQRPFWSLADYSITKRLYKGAGSSIYQATCKCSGTTVVLKVYFLSRIPFNSFHMIAREVKIHADLAHSNIIKLYGVFEEEGRLVMVQELATRGDLFG
ncbi:hypothetical protein Agub_g9298, partial [Astrephomene gubernaculifera]